MIVCGSWFVGVHITSTHTVIVCGSWFVEVHITSTQWLCVVVGLLECILLAHSGWVW